MGYARWEGSTENHSHKDENPVGDLELASKAEMAG